MRRGRQRPCGVTRKEMHVADTPDKMMDMSDVAQRLQWLDDERRRDHAELARLAQEMSGALTILKDLAGRVRTADERLATAETTLKQLPDLEASITAARSEMTPLRDADIRLEDEITRQGKDFRSHADQVSRVLSEINGRIETVSKSTDSFSQRLNVLDTQRKDHAARVAEMAIRLDAAVKTADGLAERLSLLDTQGKDSLGRIGVVATRLDTLAKTADTVVERVGVLDAQRKDQGTRVADMAVRLDVVTKAAAGLEDRLQLIDAQRKAALDRATEVSQRLDALGRAADALAQRTQVVEARVTDADKRAGSMITQISRIETTQAQAIEDVRRSVARAESLVTDMQGVRREIMLAREDDAKLRRDDAASRSEVKEAVALVERRLEEAVDETKLLTVRLAALEETPTHIAAASHRIGAVEEHLTVLQAAYKSLQEVEDRHWNTDFPQILQTVEESSAACASNAVSVQELLTSAQALKESVRELQVALKNERVYSDELAAALRSLIEEDLQGRLAATQKQLQALRRLANEPVDNAG